MPKTKFPGFRGKSESQIIGTMKSLSDDYSYRGTYHVSYYVTGEMPVGDTFGIIYKNGKGWGAERSACFAGLSGAINKYRHANDMEFPTHLTIGYNLYPFSGERYDNDDDYYEEDDDYYDEDDYHNRDKNDLSRDQIKRFTVWCIKHKLHPPIDVGHFLKYHVYTAELKAWKNINTIYFSLTMLRYIHEGQGVARRILSLDKEYDLDPYINVALAHHLQDRNYNGGHCVCDYSYWNEERYGGWGGDERPATKRNDPLNISRIAHSLRWLMEKTKSDRTKYSNTRSYSTPGFQLETTAKGYEQKLQHTSPTTWRGLLRTTT